MKRQKTKRVVKEFAEFKEQCEAITVQNAKYKESFNSIVLHSYLTYILNINNLCPKIIKEKQIRRDQEAASGL